MSNKNTFRFTPLVIAVSVVLGILIGTFYAKHYGGNKLGIINASSNKLNALLHVIESQYVDTVDMTELVENTMPQILAELDPHSTYIPAKDLQEVNSELEGSFSGVGINSPSCKTPSTSTASCPAALPKRWACWPATAS